MPISRPASQSLREIARHYLRALAAQEFGSLPWGEHVRYTENNVAMMIGDGVWGAGPGVVGQGTFLADPDSGEVAWYGITTEHGQGAYHGLRLKVEGAKITEVESYLAREGTPGPFAGTADFQPPGEFGEAIPPSARRGREQMIELVDGWFDSKQRCDATVRTEIGEACRRVINGVDPTHGEHRRAELAPGCRAQLEWGLFRPVDRIRARRYPIVDQELGVVLALCLEDHAVRYVDYQAVDGTPLKVQVEYPNTRGLFELFKIRNGTIEHIEGVSVFLPYYIQSLWTR